MNAPHPTQIGTKMAQPKRPLEFYGIPVTNPPSPELLSALGHQQCPFRGDRCIKVRKSNASQTIGACVVGYQDVPIMICPYRFADGGLIFERAAELLDPDVLKWGQVVVVPEITMPGGSVDFMVAAMDPVEGVLDFVGVEIQTLDTTGSGGIWDARVDALAGDVKESYSYGMNWKMTAKTILIQLLHKVPTFDSMGKKIVLTIQSEFFDYLTANFRMGSLRPEHVEDPLHFHVYDVRQSNGRIGFQLVKRLSARREAVLEMVQGSDTVIEVEEAAGRIMAKLPNGFTLRRQDE